MFVAFIHGFILSISLILPLGAQNVFIFNQGARSRRFVDVSAAIITASLSDTLLIVLAVGGVSLLILTFPWLITTLFIIGIVFLVYIGWTIWSESTTKKNQRSERLSAKQQVLFALSVSLLNPHAILDTIGVIGTNAIHYSGVEKWLFAASCISVSWIWFFCLALVGHLTGRAANSSRTMLFINKISALMIWSVAVYLCWALLHNK
ncbi:LysE/ArgO family amino acid transporter [Sporolactobacillus laevolacticus]|uniref:LysE family translocator protein n=1 Tax=Sporolactobacillus laevolacticus DSM 442 TaxID=1395513 RepID=V6J0C2_9BACL|nr:LysE/ArgO family amino acid transporter [Sporolactobacillus laevolacticus]EST13277.1 LysE family translocator protein [Sporolactobacillus laevolacticus DSM 442]